MSTPFDTTTQLQRCIHVGSSEWQTAVIKARGRFFHVPKAKFLRARMCEGKDNFFAKALEENPVAGTSEEHAIALEADITEGQFAIFFQFMYPMDVRSPLFSKDEWITILKLSTRWFFQDIRNLALEYLEKDKTICPAEKVHLGREYFVPRWIHSALLQLVTSKVFINARMTRYLGELAVIRLYQCRERTYLDPSRSRDQDEDGKPGIFPSPYTNAESDIRHVFLKELTSSRISAALYGTSQEWGLPAVSPDRSNPPGFAANPKKPGNDIPRRGTFGAVVTYPNNYVATGYKLDDCWQSICCLPGYTELSHEAELRAADYAAGHKPEWVKSTAEPFGIPHATPKSPEETVPLAEGEDVNLGGFSFALPASQPSPKSSISVKF